jgi:uncharacterized membrane protein YdjX (TVP38/TMEM64 family)
MPFRAEPEADLRARTARIVIAIAVLVLAGGGLFVLRLWPGRVSELSALLLRWERALGSVGWPAAMFVQLLIALCGIVPASIGALGAGLLYGTVEGFLLCGGATLAGAMLAFMLSRSMFRPLITAMLARRPRLARLDEAVTLEGWRLVSLLRISPVMPFALTSYALGLTSLPMRDYLVGTLASLPALLLYVVLGDLTGEGVASLSAGAGQALHRTLLVLAVAATVLLALLLGRILRRALALPAETSAGRSRS